MKSSSSVRYGVGMLDLLLVLFIGLKLAGKINWSWAWVLCPFWIQFVMLAIVFIVACIIMAVSKNE